MGQTCSLPCVDILEESARDFAFTQYSATGCRTATYSSSLVVRSDLPGEDLAEFAGATAMVNDPHSQSGHTILVMELERRGHRMPFFSSAGHVFPEPTRRRFGCSPRERPTLPRSIPFPTRTSSGTAIPVSARSGSSAGRWKRRLRRTSRSAARSQISRCNHLRILVRGMADPEAPPEREVLFLKEAVRPNATIHAGMEAVRAAWRRASKAGIARKWVSPGIGG